MVVCVKMMLKGSKEALTVLIVTHVILLMLKGFDFQPLQHASTYITLDGMGGKV